LPEIFFIRSSTRDCNSTQPHYGIKIREKQEIINRKIGGQSMHIFHKKFNYLSYYVNSIKASPKRNILLLNNNIS